MSNLHNLIIDIGKVADSYGYMVHIVDLENMGDELIVRFEPHPSPPALSVHITDGMGSADKVGG